MAKLEVNLSGLRLKNPVMPAAGPPVRNADCVIACAEGGAGCLVTKTISVEAAEVPRPCMQEIYGGFLNTELWSELPPERWLEEEYYKCKKEGLPLIISLGYTAEEISKLIPKVAPFADALEISTHYVGKDIEPIINSLKAAAKSNKPVFMKISPGIPDVSGYAKRLEEEGADGFVAINSVGPCLNINLETGMPFMGSSSGYGWLSGRAIKPIALRHVYEIASSVKVPVIGVGGVSTGEDALEMIMAGASAVQICTAAIINGPNIYGKVAKEMENWLDRHGYTSVEEIKGLTLKRMKNRITVTEGKVPEIDDERCTSCGRCRMSCAYQAITLKPKAFIDREKCFGCGLCVTRCAVHAIKL